MSAEEIQTVSAYIGYHPPVVITTLCIFMYIRARFLEKKATSRSIH